MKQLLILTFSALILTQSLAQTLPPVPNEAVNFGRKGDGYYWEKTKAGVERPIRVEPNTNRISVFQTMKEVRSYTLSNQVAPKVINLTDQGKSGYYVLDSLDHTSKDNTGTVLVTSSGLRYKRHYEGVIQAEWFGVRADGTTDNYTVLNLISKTFPSGITIMLPVGNITWSGTWSINPYMKLIAQGRGATTLTNTNDGVYAIECLTILMNSPYDVNASLHLEGFTLVSKYGIRLNRPGDFATVFNKLGHIKKPTILNVDFVGKYGLKGNIDPNAVSDIPIVESDLEAYGVGLKLIKVFGGTYQNLRFQNFGTCASLDGCDINLFNTCRFEGSGRHIYSYGHNTYGSQTLYLNCEWMHCLRVGGFYTVNTQFEHIQGGYFECYTKAAQYIKTENDRETLIEGARFDNTRQTNTPIFSFAPTYGLMVHSNRYNPNAYAQIISFDNKYYTSSMPVLAQFSDNAITFPPVNHAGVLTGHYLPGRISPTNYTVLYGVGANSWPFKTGVGGRPAFQTTTSSIFVQFDAQRPLSDSLRLAIMVRKIGSQPGYLKVKWGSTYVFQNHIAISNAAIPQIVTIPFARPNGQAIDAIIEIEMDNTSAEFYQFDLLPVY